MIAAVDSIRALIAGPKAFKLGYSEAKLGNLSPNDRSEAESQCPFHTPALRKAYEAGVQARFKQAIGNADHKTFCDDLRKLRAKRQ